MKRISLLLLLPICLFAAMSCGRNAVSSEPEIVVDEADAQQIFATLDTACTYRYHDFTEKQDSLLRMLIARGLPVERAFQPLDRFIDTPCSDPFGPYFVVVLARADARIEALGFTHGTGGIGCAGNVRRYVVK